MKGNETVVLSAHLIQLKYKEKPEIRCWVLNIYWFSFLRYRIRMAGSNQMKLVNLKTYLGKS